MNQQRRRIAALAASTQTGIEMLWIDRGLYFGYDRQPCQYVRPEEQVSLPCEEGNEAIAQVSLNDKDSLDIIVIAARTR